MPHNSTFGMMDIKIADAYNAPYYIHGTIIYFYWIFKLLLYFFVPHTILENVRVGVKLSSFLRHLIIQGFDNFS